MKYVRLLWKNLFRNRRRTLLTLTSIAASLFLVATLRTVLTELQNPPETPDSALRLIVRHRISLFNVLPAAYREKIAQVEEVEGVVGSMWFGGVYKEPANFFAQFATHTDQFFLVHPDFEVPEDQKEAFLADRTGALAGTNLARRFGWKIGDRIHLQRGLWPVEVELTLRALYEGGSDDGASLFFHWDYFNEAMSNQGFVGTYTIRARSAEPIPAIAEGVDELFRNTSVPTKTETEKSFVLGFVSMMGNVQFLINSICLVVIFTIVLVAANTMAMSIRERAREIGILKAVGFRQRQVLALLLSESVLLALGGALLGSWGARLLYQNIPMAQITSGFIQRFHVNTETLLLCAAIGILVGLLAAGIPAWRAARRPVVEALRSVA